MDQKDTVVFGKSIRGGYGAICPAIKEGNEEINGAIYHILFLSLSKTFTSISCAIINAVPDPIAIRIEIKS